MLKIDHHSGVPAYKQLMEQIRFQIGSGLLKAGDEMPSTRELSAKLELNPMTISKAFSLLQRDGVLEGRRGKPLTVCEVGEEKLEESRAEQVGQALGPGVRAARQLGVSKTEAVRILKELFDEQEQKGTK